LRRSQEEGLSARIHGLAKHAIVPLISAALFVVTGVRAQGYPVKPIRIVVAYPPGGANDVAARTLGQKLSEALGQAVTVENRSGAAGNIGAQYVAGSPPDGYTLLCGASALTIAPALVKHLSYDVAKDFAPISMIAGAAPVLATHPSVPANSVKELVALAKARPGQLTYASSGVGAPPHLAGEMLKNMAQIDILHVPYRGAGQSISDLVGGQFDMLFTPATPVAPLAKAGRLKVLGVTTARRSSLLPEVPTIAESGVKGYELGTWWGLLAPAGTADDIISRLNNAVVKTVNTVEFRERLSAQGIDPGGSTPAEFAAHIKAEIAKFSRLVKAAGIHPE
jgi:tripartite-type tricarboxylate transporter receptor subunit TctC